MSSFRYPGTNINRSFVKSNSSDRSILLQFGNRVASSIALHRFAPFLQYTSPEGILGSKKIQPTPPARLAVPDRAHASSSRRRCAPGLLWRIRRFVLQGHLPRHQRPAALSRPSTLLFLLPLSAGEDPPRRHRCSTARPRLVFPCLRIHRRPAALSRTCRCPASELCAHLLGLGRPALRKRPPSHP